MEINGDLLLKIEEEYLTINDDVDDERLIKVKQKLARLPQSELNMLVLFLELGSYAAVGRQLNVSSTYISKKIKEIIQKLR